MKSKWVTFSIQIIITFIFLFLTFQNTQLSDLKKSIENINYWLLILSVMPQLSTIYLLAMREKYLLKKLYSFKTKHLTKAVLISIIGNNILPFRAGEFLKTYYWARISKQPYTTLLSVTMLERVLDFGTMTGLFLLTSKTILKKMGIQPLWVIVTFCCTLLSVFILYKLDKKYEEDIEDSAKNTNSSIKKIHYYIKHYAKKISIGLRILESKKDVGLAIFFTIAYWIANFIALILMLIAFHFTFTTAQCAVILLATTLGVAIPSAPGYIGTLDYFTKMVLVLYGINHSTAASFAIVSHFFTIVPITVVSLLFAYPALNHLLKSKKESTQDSNTNASRSQT